MVVEWLGLWNFSGRKKLAVLAAIGGELADARLVMALRDRAASVAAPAAWYLGRVLRYVL